LEWTRRAGAAYGPHLRDGVLTRGAELRRRHAVILSLSKDSASREQRDDCGGCQSLVPQM
jgi:hypothetical protein